jgi:acetolactate synthase-1/2/3 large subunit
MDPQQPFLPKLSLANLGNGTLISPPLEDLSPFIPRDELEKNMIAGVHDKSKQIEVA